MTEIVRPVHWFHCWVGDAIHSSLWELPARQHFQAMRIFRFDGDVRVGLVGGLPERAEARRKLLEWWPEARISVQAEEGYEQVTIDAMHAWCKETDPSTPVFYSHTKGAFQPSPMNTRWRHAMESLLLDYWQDRVEDLRTYDAVGLHWLTYEQYPELIDPRKPMFGGNYWWANAGYLAKLDRVTGTPEFPPINRWAAEGWMGQGFPKVRDLVKGWPDYTYDHPLELA